MTDADGDYENKRKHTVIRIDAAPPGPSKGHFRRGVRGGTDTHINNCLQRNYLLMTKIFNWKRVRKLTDTVQTWTADPELPHRQLSWIAVPHPYQHATRQVAIRHLKQDGTWAYSVLVFNLSDEHLATMLNMAVPTQGDNLQRMLNALHVYDQRGGGIETQNKVDKQGLSIGHRNKHSFIAQEKVAQPLERAARLLGAMLMLLAQLAHNYVISCRNQLTQVNPRFRQFSMTRMTRDVFHIPGTLTLNLDHYDIDNPIRSLSPSLSLNPRHPYAADFLSAFGCRYE